MYRRVLQYIAIKVGGGPNARCTALLDTVRQELTVRVLFYVPNVFPALSFVFKNLFDILAFTQSEWSGFALIFGTAH
jgi:hypothetical protein